MAQGDEVESTLKGSCQKKAAEAAHAFALMHKLLLLLTDLLIEMIRNNSDLDGKGTKTLSAGRPMYVAIAIGEKPTERLQKFVHHHT